LRAEEVDASKRDISFVSGKVLMRYM